MPSGVFLTMQNVKMHLRAAFDVSTSFHTSDLQPFQDAVQGNGEAPALWLIMCIFLIKYLYQQNIVTSITSTISRLSM